MSVKDAVRTVTVPTQAGPADPPLESAPATQAPIALPNVGVPGRDRPLNRDEKEFVLMIGAVFGVLSAFIVTFLLLSVHVW